MHSPDAVQHCAAILLPAGVTVAAGAEMQTPRAGLSWLPLRAIALKASGVGNGGEGDDADRGAGAVDGSGHGDTCGDGMDATGGCGGGDAHGSPVHTYALL